MKKRIILFLLTLTTISIQAQDVAILQDTIPFRNDLGLIIIPITFNGVEKQFAFDTGAQATVVFSWAKEELKRTSKKIKVTSSNGSKAKMRIYKSGVVRLGSKEINDHTSIMVGDSSIFDCYEIDGILGVDIIKQYNWAIDFESNQLIMYDSTYFPPSTDLMNSLQFTFKRNKPLVYTDLNGKEIKFLLDTGAGGLSDLNNNDYLISDLEEYSHRKVYSGFYDVNGTLTPTKSVETVLPNMTSNEITLAPIVDYGGKTTKIGNVLWGELTLFLSLANEKLLVSKQEINVEINDYDCSVVFLDGNMRVMVIYEDSPAWDLGIRQGDIVKSFNEKSFTDFCSFDQYKRNLISFGEDITLVLEDGKAITISKKSMF